MTQEKLQSLPDHVLKQLASRLHVLHQEQMSREDLAQAVFEAISEDQEESFNSAPRFWSELSKYDQGHDNIDLVGEDELRLPQSYNFSHLTVLQRDPSWFFVFWDLAPHFLGKWGLRNSSKLVLRMGGLKLVANRQKKIDYSTKICVRVSEKRHYVNLVWGERVYCWAEICLAQPKAIVLLRSRPFIMAAHGLAERHLSAAEVELLRLSGVPVKSFYPVGEVRAS